MHTKAWFIRSLSEIKPWSVGWAALIVGALAVATGVRLAFASLGSTLYFASYFPSILVVSLFGGAQAGIVSTVLTLCIVWWAFIPPPLEFSPLRATDYGNFALFVVSAMLIVWLTVMYRRAVWAIVEGENQRKLVVEELNHRSGNLLATVQAVINGTLVEEKEAAERLSDRINALARANAMLRGDGTTSLEAILKSEAAPYTSEERLRLKGPRVDLDGRTAHSLAMVLHELTTNAAKYGAFKNEKGILDVSWGLQGETCTLLWKEIDGPAVSTPTRLGFGSRMMRASLSSLQGNIDPEFRPDGYSCRLTFSTASSQLGAVARKAAK